MMIASPLTIRLDRHSGRITMDRPRASGLARLLIGRPVEDVLRMVPAVFNLCRSAHSVASQMAFLGTAPDGIDNAMRQLLADIIRDHLLHICQRWPRLRGVSPLTGAPMTGELATDPAAILRLRDWLAGAVYGEPSAVWLRRNDLEDWTATGTTATARLLGALAAQLGGDIGVCRIDPTASAIGRVADHAMVAGLAQAGTAGLNGRMAGRLVEVARLTEALASGDIPAHYRPGSDRAGMAYAEASRGRLTYSAEVADGIVRRLDIAVPTDAILAANGILEEALTDLSNSADGIDEALLALVVDAVDPCVPVRIEVVSHA